MKPYLRVNSVSKRFGSFEALRDISFDIYPGEFVCFLGPSGCGKTTLLRCIAGLETQTSGQIIQADQDISNWPVSKRDFGIVFQSYALFPNLTVGSNVAYGLINQNKPKEEIASRVAELLELVHLSGHIDKHPNQLSGGEQQRVALIRALATSPGLLLLDEPLSALDAKVRGHLRREIRELQKRLGVTTIMVTHDQEEAQAMADRILVMRQGEVEQIGNPWEIYDNPASPFVAEFIGSTNFISVTVTDDNKVRCGEFELSCDASGFSSGATARAAIRPEDIQILKHIDGTSLAARVNEIEHLGAFVRLYLAMDGLPDQLVMADVGKGALRQLSLKSGDKIGLSFPQDSLRLFAVEE